MDAIFRIKVKSILSAYLKKNNSEEDIEILDNVILTHIKEGRIIRRCNKDNFTEQG
jgi:DNA recombination-dependent growth factor C